MRLVIAAVFVVLAGRLVLVQGLEAHSYQAIGAAEVTATESQPALRGGIYDRNGAVLAMSVPTDDVVADPLLINHPQTVAAALASARTVEQLADLLPAVDVRLAAADLALLSSTTRPAP